MAFWGITPLQLPSVPTIPSLDTRLLDWLHVLRQKITSLVGSEISMPSIGTAPPTYTTIEDVHTLFHSSGWITGGTVTQASATTVDVSAGSGFIRASASDPLSTLYLFDWTASAGLSVPNNTVRYIGVEYNSGAPQVVIRTSYNWNFYNEFPLAVVINNGVGLHIMPHQFTIGDHAALMWRHMHEVDHIERAHHLGGIILGQSGDDNRYVTLTAGTLWMALNRYSVAAINTGTGGVFGAYYRDGVGGWTAQANQTSWNNTKYDDNSGTLANLTAAHYGVHWWYVETDGQLTMLYGQDDYLTVAAAEDAEPPSTVPSAIEEHGMLIGRFIFQRGSNTATIESAFTTTFSPAGVTDHGNLSGLGDDDHTQYLLAAGTRALTADWDAGSFEIRAQTFESDVATGTTPLVIASTTLVTNLNADLLDGQHGSYYWPHAIDDLTDVVITAVAAGHYLRYATATYSLSQTTSGLVIFDDFDVNGVATDTVGNGWTEGGEELAADWRITTDDLLEESTTDVSPARTLYRSSPTLPTNFIVQCNMECGATTSFARLMARYDADATADLYDLGMDNSNNELELRHITNGAITNQNIDSLVVADNVYRTIRLVGYVSGSDFKIAGYKSAALGSLPWVAATMNAALTAMDAEVTDAAPYFDPGTHPYYGLNPSRTSKFKMFLACGRNVTITNVPTGYKGRLDSGTAVTESGGTITINVDGIALPATTLYLLDADDNAVASITPAAITGRQGDALAGGIVGGDVYDATAGSAGWINVPIGEILDDLTTVDGAGSGLDADLLDGQSGSYYWPHAIDDLSDVTIAGAVVGDYLRYSGAAWVDVTISQVLTDLLTVDGPGSGLNADLLDGIDSTGFSLAGHTHALNDLSDVDLTGLPPVVGSYIRYDGVGTWEDVQAATLLSDLLTVDGPTSGLDADLLDGQHGAYYAVAANVLLKDGSVALTADWDAGNFEIRSSTFESDVATGTAPFTVASTTVVTNLNADLLDGINSNVLFVADSALIADSEPWDLIVGKAAGGTTWEVLPKGTSNQYLRMAADGNSFAWTTVPAAGDVTKVGTPLATQVGVWTGDGTLAGYNDFIYDDAAKLVTLGGTGGTAGLKILADAVATLLPIEIVEASTVDQFIDWTGADGRIGWDGSAGLLIENYNASVDKVTIKNDTGSLELDEGFWSFVGSWVTAHEWEDALEATVPNQAIDSPSLKLTSKYWTGAASADQTWQIYANQVAAADESSDLVFLDPDSVERFRLSDDGILTLATSITFGATNTYDVGTSSVAAKELYVRTIDTDGANNLVLQRNNVTQLTLGDSLATFLRTINLTPTAGDIGSPANGDIWYNSTTGKFRKYQDGAVSDLDTTGGGSSETITVDDWVAYEALSQGDVVYLRYDSSDARLEWAKADADLADFTGKFIPTVGIAQAAAAAGATVTVVTKGRATAGSWTLSTDGGEPAYLTTTAGSLSLTPPSSAGAIVYKIGVVVSATEIYVDPTYVWETA